MMDQEQVGFLRRGAALARDDEVAGGEALGLAAAAAEEGDGLEVEALRLAEGGEDIGGVAARGEDDEENALNRAVVCTLGWDGVKRDGKALECTPANVRELYANAPWLKDQVLAFLGTGENFIDAAETN